MTAARRTTTSSRRPGGRLGLVTTLIVSWMGVAGLGSLVSAAPAGAVTPSAPLPGRTPLPAGWELCVLQGVGAQPTANDLADLDAWQAAEGGSTNNAAAYNPFNTKQTADAQGAALPMVGAYDGFPAFATWAGGCAATVATLLQPDMGAIVQALQAGGVAPPGLYLAVVDETPWCAPSAGGLPCYASEIVAAELLDRLVNGAAAPLSDALTSYSGLGPALASYDQDANAMATDEAAVASATQQVALAEQTVSGARAQLAAADSVLRQVAVTAYMDDGRTTPDADVAMLAPSDDESILADYYGAMAVDGLVARYDQAQAALKAAQAQQRRADQTLAGANATLSAAQVQEQAALTQLDAEVTAFESVSCAVTGAAPVTAAGSGASSTGPASAAGATSSATSTTTTSTTTTSTTTTSTTTTSTTAPATAAQGTSTAGSAAVPGTSPAGAPTAPPSPPPSAGQLWTGLQTCLAPAPSVSTPGSTPSALIAGLALGGAAPS